MTTNAPLLGRRHFWSIEMREYPKMLYIGKAQSHKHKTARNEQHEIELRELGFVNFADLEKEEPVNNAVGSASAEDFENAFISVEQFDSVCEDLVQKELQLSVAQTERDQFKAENDDLKAQLHQAHEANKQLQQALDSLQPEPAPQDTTVDPVMQSASTEPVAPDYSKATAKELREALDAKGIKYLQRDNVDTLRALLTQPEKTEE
ncbi:hypothetical protein F4U02_13235 [Acinetobacter haemolyticus]|uniref:hypothetical protein n=1 Tax=Acinetobacter haemolyticus TaxID=29430 RepID=UPI0012986718|nr:hypothetical protein [Acinetobacter haemolyticus]MQZ31948.1 hypothetical protein [Acinetobacter haemolyticus]